MDTHEHDSGGAPLQRNGHAKETGEELRNEHGEKHGENSEAFSNTTHEQVYTPVSPKELSKELSLIKRIELSPLVTSALVSLIITSGLMVLALFVVLANKDAVIALLRDVGADSNNLSLSAGARNASFAEQTSGTASIIDTVERVNPAVVSIVVTKDVPVLERYYEEFDPFGDGNGVFRIPRQRQNGTQEQEIGGGSGFFVSEDGLVVTNRHVVSDEDAQYTVLTNTGDSLLADVVARDPVLDIAILKVQNSQKHPYLSFGNSDVLMPGQTVIAIGNALGEFRNSVSVGVVSGLSRSIIAGDGRGMSEQLDEVIQTDAAINPGNSGGPLLNTQGEVVGVNVATSFSAENIGFALPSNAVQSIVESIKQYGIIQRAYLGVRYTQITPQFAEMNNLSIDYGALVIRGDVQGELAVLPGSPADKAGIEENDILLAINGTELKERSLASVIRNLQIGQTVSVKLLHDGEEKTVQVTLEKAPE